MYNPPSESTWVEGEWEEWYIEAYDQGWNAAQKGKKYKDNPYEDDYSYLSTHNTCWYRGFTDYGETAGGNFELK